MPARPDYVPLSDDLDSTVSSVSRPPAVFPAATPPNLWGAGLASRRFRTILLVLAGVPIGLAYLEG